MVYEAVDPRLERTVAVKVLRGRAYDLGRSQSALRRLAREARVLARLSHPNIVSLHDIGTYREGDEDALFLVMERLRGVDLLTWAETRSPSWQETVDVLIRAGQGLAAAHAAGIVHRDFKPSNVMVGPDTKVRVIDFGLARVATARERYAAMTHTSKDGGGTAPSLTATGSTLGTPLLMAPEQHRNAFVDARSDQFAFRVTAYRVLYGRWPFEGDGLLRSKTHGPPEPPTTSRVPKWIFRDVLERGLQPDPPARFPNMGELLRVLRRGRYRGRRRIRNAVTFAVGLGGLVLGAAMVPADHRQCEERGEELLLELRRRHEPIALQFASQSSWTRRAWGPIAEGLNRHESDLVDATVDVCRAPHEQKLECLARHRRDLEATLELLADVEAQEIERAMAAIHALGDPQHCLRPTPTNNSTPSLPEHEALHIEFARIRAQLELGRFDTAAEMLAQLDVRDEVFSAPPLLGELRMLQGKLAAEQGDYESARHAYEQAFAVSLGGSDRLAAARAASELVFVTGARHEGLAESRRWLERARRHLAGLDAPTIRAALLHNLAAGQLVHGEPEALDSFEHALELRRNTLGPSHTETLASRKGRAQALALQSRYEEAERELHLLLEQRISRFGPQNPSVGAIWLDIGEVQQLRGQYTMALQSLDEALANYESAGLDRHPSALVARSRRVSVLTRLGQLDEAEAEARAVLQARREAFGPQHESVATSLVELGTLLRGQGRLDEAQALFEQVLDITSDEVRAGAAHHVLGLMHDQSGDVEAALASYSKALELVRSKLGEHDPRVAKIHYALGLLFYRRDDWHRAMRHFVQSLEATDRGEKTMFTLFLWNAAAKTSLHLDDPKRALELSSQAVKAMSDFEDLSDSMRGSIHFVHGRALWLNDEDRARARHHFEEARRSFASSPEWIEHLAELNRWVDAHIDP